MEVFLKKQNTIENRVITLTGFNKSPYNFDNTNSKNAMITNKLTTKSTMKKDKTTHLNPSRLACQICDLVVIPW
jgi:hypothetical protein